MIFYVCISFSHGRKLCCTDPCQDITSFTSGNVSYYSDGTTTYASFSCASGYYRVGGSTLRCLTSGDWDGAPPVCCKPWRSLPKLIFSRCIRTLLLCIFFRQRLFLVSLLCMVKGQNIHLIVSNFLSSEVRTFKTQAKYILFWVLIKRNCQKYARVKYVRAKDYLLSY